MPNTKLTLKWPKTFEILPNLVTLLLTKQLTTTLQVFLLYSLSISYFLRDFFIWFFTLKHQDRASYCILAFTLSWLQILPNSKWTLKNCQRLLISIETLTKIVMLLSKGLVTKTSNPRDLNQTFCSPF